MPAASIAKILNALPMFSPGIFSIMPGVERVIHTRRASARRFAAQSRACAGVWLEWRAS